MSETNFPQPPLGYTALRRELRTGLSTQARQIWWPNLPRIPDGAGITVFSNVSELATNRYKWANADVNFDPNSSIDVKALYIVQLIVNQFQLFDQELITTLAKIIAKELSNVALAFSTLCEVMDRGQWFFPTDAAMQRTRFETFRQLLNRYDANFFDVLQRINGLDDKYMELFFTKLFVDLLPDDSVKRLVMVPLIILIFIYHICSFRWIYSCMKELKQYTDLVYHF